MIELGLRKSRARRQLAGPLQLCIERGRLGAEDAHFSNEDARRSTKDKQQAIRSALGLYRDGFKESGRKELAQASSDCLPVERLALGLGQTSRQGCQTIQGDAHHGDTPHRQALPGVERISMALHSRVGRSAGVALHHPGLALAPQAARDAEIEDKNRDEEIGALQPSAVLPCWHCLQE